MRSLSLNWQPLWWDEGYSLYFATEPVGRMVQLTAQDIHPPLYYALLHGWLAIERDGWLLPVWSRAFSVVVGILTIPLFTQLTRTLFPDRQRLAILATALLAFNPLHLFYSQEVRMYGLAMALGIGATLCLWLQVAGCKLQVANSKPDSPLAPRPLPLAPRPSPLAPLLAYWLCATLALHTLYYMGFLLAAHALWVLWQMRTSQLRLFWLRLRPWLLTWFAIGLAYLPWLLYAGNQLVVYVENKVAVEKDTPLSLPDFVQRHLTAFVSGHRLIETSLSQTLLQVGLFAIVLCLLLNLYIRSQSNQQQLSHAKAQRTQRNPLSPSPSLLVSLSLLLPALCAFVVNQNQTFFPNNGERLLLFVLPYFLLLLAAGIDTLWDRLWWSGRILAALIVVCQLAGLYWFYTVPRYTEDDYRPIIRQIVQQSQPQDTFLAAYPWQIGLWRAYAPPTIQQAGDISPLLLSDGSVEWNGAVATRMDAALQRGMLWIPQLLSVGSSLPESIDAHLRSQQAYNFVYDWYSTTTRLDAWRAPAKLPIQPIRSDFAGIALIGVGQLPASVPSDNTPLPLLLQWQRHDTNRPYHLSLRLQDAAGHTWAQRDAQIGIKAEATEQEIMDRVGLIVPAGLPPGPYQLRYQVSQQQNGERPTAIPLPNQAGETFGVIGVITVTQPAEALSALRLPIQHSLSTPLVLNGVSLLGYTAPNQAVLAGDALPLTFFWQNGTDRLPRYRLYTSLLDRNGASVAGWEGWPLPDYTSDQWPMGALVQLPVEYYLPATVSSGSYHLVVGWIDETSGIKQTYRQVGEVAVVQRHANFTPQTPPHPFDPPFQLGIHTRLRGYALNPDAQGVTVELYWEVLQPLLPPHQIFVHFNDANGSPIAQIDGEPITADGLAPTGSWQVDEKLITQHRLVYSGEEVREIQVGLYNPLDMRRLAVSANGQIIGDAVRIDVAP